MVASAVAVPLYLNQGSSDTSTISSLQGQLSAASKQVTTLQGQFSSASTAASAAQAAASAAQAQLAQNSAFLILNPREQVIVEAIAETFIPSDASGPGASLSSRCLMHPG